MKKETKENIAIITTIGGWLSAILCCAFAQCNTVMQCIVGTLLIVGLLGMFYLMSID